MSKVNQIRYDGNIVNTRLDKSKYIYILPESPNYLAMFYKNQFNWPWKKKQSLGFSGIRIVLVVLFYFLLVVTPVVAQNNTFFSDKLPQFTGYPTLAKTKATITIDAQEIFQVSGTK